MPDKKELNEAEARMVLDLIKNTNGEWNKTEIEYFKQELIQAGYGDLLDEVQNGQGSEDVKNNSGENKVETPEKPTEEAVPDEPAPTEDKSVEKEVPAEPTPGETAPSNPPAGKEPPINEKPPMDKKPPMDEKPPIDKKPPINENPPVDKKPPIDEEPPIDEGPNKTLPKQLTDEQKAEAQNAGKKIAQYLGGYTMDIEQAHVVEYTKKELNSENIVEFMKGYAKGGADPFFKQLLTEYDFPEKNDVARDVAQKMLDYIKDNGISEKDCKIIDGILAKDEFSKSDIAELDKITESLTEMPVNSSMFLGRLAKGAIVGIVGGAVADLSKDVGEKNVRKSLE